MFQTASGVEIPNKEAIKEQYQCMGNSLLLNLSFEKMESLLLDFIDMIQPPLFLILQLPLNEAREAEYRKKDNVTFHCSVCYLDGQTKDQLLTILKKYGTLLLNDGMSEFGVASHTTGEELFFRKYKIIQLYSKQLDRFFPLMEKYGVRPTKQLKTVWDTFSPEHPGNAYRITIGGIDVYDVFEELQRIGMYEYEVIAED